MTIEETKQIVDKIKIHRPSFGGQFDKSGLDKLKLEWFRILEPYDYDDVNKKLDEYFKNGDNFGKYPDVYYLIKYLTKHEDKLKSGVIYVRCQICKNLYSLTEYNEHFEKCNSIDYLCSMSLKYFNKKLNREKLENANKTEFDKYYWEFLDKLYDVVPEGCVKHCLKNTILTHNGYDPEYSLSEVM